MLGISCLLGMGECLPCIVGGCGSALQTFTFFPPLVTTLVIPVGPCLPILTPGLLLCRVAIALVLKGELLWLNFEEDAPVFCPTVTLEREVELWPASLWWGECPMLALWWRGVLWVEQPLCVLLIFSSSSIVMTVLPPRTRLRVASDKTDLLKDTLLPLVEFFILVGDITLEGVLRRWGWERDWPHGMESWCCWLGTSPTPSMSITDVFEGATIYLLLLVEFLDTAEDWWGWRPGCAQCWPPPAHRSAAGGRWTPYGSEEDQEWHLDSKNGNRTITMNEILWEYSEYS